MQVLFVAAVLGLCVTPAVAAIGAVVTMYTCNTEAAFVAIEAAYQASPETAFLVADDYTQRRACVRTESVIIRLDGDTLQFPPIEFIRGDMVDIPKEQQEWKVKFYVPFAVEVQPETY